MFLTKFENYPYLARQLAMEWAASRHYAYRFGGEFPQMQRMLDETRLASQTEQETWQLERLAQLVETSRSGCVYYADRLPEASQILSSRSLDTALQSIPILEKSCLRSRTADFANRNVPLKLSTSTSGSTGAPMTVGQDADSAQRRFAFLCDHFRLAGITREQPSVRLGGRVLCKIGTPQRRPWLHNRKENVLFLSSYHLDDQHGQVIARKLNTFQPVLMDGYPSGILQTLRLVSQHGGVPTSLKAIITTAETLYPDLREELEQLSGVPVMDYYGASEGVPYIHQCPYGTYHVRWQSGIFEVDDGTRVSREGSGELITTSFVQDRTPLIRYRTGDVLNGLRQNPDTPCQCGLLTPTVESVQGRLEDFVYTSDGRTLGMFTYRTLKYIKGLGETQVIQEQYDEFVVNSVLDNEADAESIQSTIKESFERALGYPIRLNFQPVSQLEKTKNGKVRLVISKMVPLGSQGTSA